MFKRTKGYLLLTMLVLTGLAGRIHSDTLSGKDRRILVKDLKSTKADFTESIKGLSYKQLNFTTAKNKLSIRECIYQLASIENSLWNTSKACLQQEPLQQKKAFRDDELISCILNEQCILPFRQLKFKNIKEATKLYKNETAEILKYVNTSTENIRAHVTSTSIGNLDAYQLMLITNVYTRRFTDQIIQIKSAPNFPK